nr:hypothetical protein [Nostoc sp. DedSLP05]
MTTPLPKNEGQGSRTAYLLKIVSESHVNILPPKLVFLKPRENYIKSPSWSENKALKGNELLTYLI